MRKVFQFVLLFFLVVSLRAQVSGSAQLTVSAVSSGSLLNGATVTSDTSCATSTISTAVPAGWTLVCAQGFEHGIGPNQNNNQPAGNSAVVTTAQSHTGTHSIGGAYLGDGYVLGWGLDAGHWFGNFGTNWTELYISYWDYTDSNALYANSDYFLGGVSNQNGCSGVGQDIDVDAQYFGAGASTPSADFIVIGQGSTSDATCQGYYQYNTGATLRVNAGVWRQYEIHIKPSTVVTSTACYTNGNANGSDCTGNGEEEMYVNGVLVQQTLNADLNGSQNMGNPSVYVGGVITSFCAAGTGPDGCATGYTGGPDMRCNPFTVCPGTTPGTGAPTAFHRYFDDVIILKK